MATRSATARRREGFETEIEIREHRLIADETAEDGGNDKGPRPTELLAGALASCTTITLVMYGDRKGWDLGAIETAVDYEPPTAHTKARFRSEIRIPGELTDEQREKLLIIAGKCPVHRTLAGQDVELEYELVELG